MTVNDRGVPSTWGNLTLEKRHANRKCSNKRGTRASYSVGFSIQDEAMGVARSAPQGAHYYHADVIYLLL